MAIELASRVNTTYPTNPTFADGANLERGIVYWGQVIDFHQCSVNYAPGLTISHILRVYRSNKKGDTLAS